MNLKESRGLTEKEEPHTLPVEPHTPRKSPTSSSREREEMLVKERKSSSEREMRGRPREGFWLVKWISELQ